MSLISVLVGFTVLIVVGAALHDLAFRTLPNWMSGLIALAGITARVMEGDFVTGFFSCGMVFLGALLCWCMGWLGGGDVKLVGACALVVPPGLVVPLLLCTALAGGVLSMLYFLLGRVLDNPPRRRPVGLLPRILRVERYRVIRRGSLPYACAIAAGASFMLLKA